MGVNPHHMLKALSVHAAIQTKQGCSTLQGYKLHLVVRLPVREAVHP